MKIGIIGAGIAGLAAAVRMAARGHEVEVFEANEYPGGKLSEFYQDGFRFDAGPSLFTMPQYVEELFRMAGEDPGHHFHYLRLPVICRYFWEDGTRLAAHADPEAFALEVERQFQVAPANLNRLLDDSRRKYEVTGRIFLEKSLHRLDTWRSKEVARAMLQIPALDLFTSMNKVNERLIGHPKLVQLFNRFATYNGSNPYKAPGLLTIIPHFEHHIGAFYPSGGMHAITRAIFNLARQLGVRFYFSTRVEKIIVENRIATGLETAEKQYRYDRLISNMDVFFTYRKLMPDQKQPEHILRQEKSTSALIFYWGIRRTFPDLDLHNIFFSDDYRTEFDFLSRGKICHDPTVYVNITKKYSPEDAPEGYENWFTMINVPFDSGQNWDALIQTARENILGKLSRMLGTDLQALITNESVLDPRGIEAKTASHLGALYGTSSNNRMAAFLRHANFSGKVKNLYFCGGSVHPGGGIPLSLLSARIVDELMHPEK